MPTCLVYGDRPTPLRVRVVVLSLSLMVLTTMSLLACRVSTNVSNLSFVLTLR